MLSLLRRRGPTYHKLIHSEFGEGSSDALIRLKSRGLIVPRREESGYYKYDITELVLMFLTLKLNLTFGILD